MMNWKDDKDRSSPDSQKAILDISYILDVAG